MKMNNKAMMVQFIAVTVLAIMLFTFTSCGVSKELRVSGEAKGNYNTFVDEIYGTIYNSEEDDKIRNYALIMDSETVIAYFSGPQIVVDAESTSSKMIDHKIIIERPVICEPTPEELNQDFDFKGCFCLFGSVEVDPARIENDYVKVLIKPITADCRKVEFEVDYHKDKVGTCGVGIPVNLESYQCAGGFFIDRDVVCPGPDDQNYKKVCYKNSARRVNILIEKVGEDKALINEQ